MYHIQKTRLMGYTHIAAVMSGNTVQRGDIAICDAHSRAETAVRFGADLVIELPPPYCLASACDFARAGVHIIKSLGGFDALSFGSECGDISRLSECADAKDIGRIPKIRSLMSDGKTYPQAVFDSLEEYSDILSKPNNTLAVEYISALKGTKIRPVTVMRTVFHDSAAASGSFASASEIRRLLLSGENADEFLPVSPPKADISDIRSIEKALLFKIAASDTDAIKNAPYTKDGVAERISEYAFGADSLDDLYTKVKTKNVTHARVRRAVILSCLGASKEDISVPPYARILALNDRGAEILAEFKKSSTIPFSSSLADLSKTSPQAKRCAELTELASRLRFLARRGGYSGFVSEYSKKVTVLHI